MKKTKIVATIGPASSSKEVLLDMMNKGMNVCRLNFSHGNFDDHLKAIQNIREINEEKGTNLAILGDLQGPKIRVGEMEEGTVLTDGQDFTFTTEDVKGTKDQAYIKYAEFPRDVKPGERILVDDGKLMFEVLSSDGKKEVKTRVVYGGTLSSKKGVNLPNTKISMPSLTEKDQADLAFILEQELDWVALSFVRSARDIIELKHLIKDKTSHTRVIAKIEKPEAIDDLNDIVRETDGVMIARGDLGVEIPMEEVPLVQKMIVRKCRRQGKPVIIATQMMETMITSITPTRAEVNDVANAVLDGADAVMLSGETSVGRFPVKVIETMATIVSQVEKSDEIYHHETVPVEEAGDRFITDSVCYNAVRLAQRVSAKAIVTMTHSGYTALKLSSQRPKAQVIVFTSNEKAMKQLSLVWGVRCFHYDKMVSTDHTIADIKYILRTNGGLEVGDYIVNTASMPMAERGMTNMLKLSQVQ